MKTICYYHNDPDGIMSGAIVKKYYMDNKEILELRPINYDYDFQKEIKYVEDNFFNTIIIVDFCFPEEIMNYFISIMDDFIWIDHHQIIDTIKLTEEVRGLRSKDNSGCALTWEYFFTEKRMPNSVKWIEDLDLWKWQYSKESKPFINAFAIKINNPDNVFNHFYLDYILDYDKEIEFINIGKNLIEAQNSRVKKSFEQGIDIDFFGYKTRLINSNHDDSQIGEYCYNEKNYDIGMIWKVTGSKITIGLRSKQGTDINVGELAKKMGGGGHFNASGFVITFEQFYYSIWNLNNKLE